MITNKNAVFTMISQILVEKIFKKKVTGLLNFVHMAYMILVQVFVISIWNNILKKEIEFRPEMNEIKETFIATKNKINIVKFI